MANKAELELSARDTSRAAFDSVLKSMDEVKGKADYVKGGLAALTASIAGASFVGLIKSSIDAADNMGKMAEKAGIAVEEYSALSFAAKKLDVDQESLNAGVKKLNVSLAEAAAGSREKAAMFDALGVSYKNADGSARGVTEVLKDLATKYAGAADGPEKIAYALGLMGKAGEQMIPFLNKGGAEITRLMEAAREAGRVIDQETADAADKFNKNLEALGNSSKKLANSLAKELLPDLTDITNAMIEAKKESGLLYALWVGLGGVASKAFERGSAAIDAAQTARVRELEKFIADNEAAAKNNPVRAALLGNAQREVAELKAALASRQEKAPPPAPKPDAIDKPKLDTSGLKPEKDAREKAAKDLTAMYEREARAIVEGEEQAAKDTADAWKAWEQIQVRDAEEAAKMTALQWKQVFDEIDAEQERAVEEGKKYLDTLEAEGRDNFRRLEDAVRGWGNAFTDTVADMVMGAKFSFGDLANSIIRDLVRIQVRKNLTDPLVQAGTSALDGFFGRTAGGNGSAGIDAIESGAAGGGGGLFSGIKKLFGFASGGSFKVGGAGGTDSQLVAFRASPDETVSVTRPGQAAGGGVVVNVINQSAQPLDARASAPRIDGGRMIVDVFVNALRTDGNLRDNVRGMLAGAPA